MRNQGIGSWPARRARMSPGRTALVCEGSSWTYGLLDERVNRLASALRALGVRHGDRVGYLGVNRPSAVETLFAAGALGAVHVPVNARLAAPEVRYIVQDAGVGVLVHGPEHAGVAAEAGARVLVGDDYEKLLAAADPEPIDEPVALDELCLIMYTSGTTGHPKGAMLTHANLVWNTYNHLIDVDLAGDEVALVVAPLFHIAALAQTLLPTMLKGGKAVILSSFDAERVLGLIESERITFMFGVPAMFGFLAESPRWESADLSSLRILECGGAPVPEPLIRRYQERGLAFLQGYGMTEAAPGVLYLGAADSVRKAGTAGVPSFFTDARVITSDGRQAGPGEPGEVVVHGPNVMRGYWGRPEETARVLSADGWFRSGDVAVADEEGYVRIVDRVNDMIISGGENVYPAEVENALLGHPAVAECAVIGIRDDRWGEVGKALVVRREGRPAEAAEILAHLDGRLARYKIPKVLEFVTSLPRNASGKVLKARLRKEHGHTSTGPPLRQ
jgi:fatty-acyl-CoA synthase